MVRLIFIAAALFFSTLPSPAEKPSQLKLIPEKLTLHGPASRQQVLVESFHDGAFRGQFVDGITLQSSDPTILKIDGSVAIPVANGAARIIARKGSQTVSAEV